MPMIDPSTGEFSSAAFALDDHQITSEQPSLFDNISDIATKGTLLTGLSIVNSFANTGVEVANLFGAGLDKVKIEDEVGDGSLKDYYDKHSQGIETAGLIVGSLAPGLGAIKGASMGVKAMMLAKTGLSSEALSAATGILGPLKAKIVQSAISEIEDTGALYNTMWTQKAAAITAGVFDQAAQGMIYSAATAATMHASPLLDDKGLSDTINDVFYGAVAGGLIGGPLEAIGTRAIFNRALLYADKTTKPQEVATYLGLGNYTAGDKIAELLNSIDEAPAPITQLETAKSRIRADQASLNTKNLLRGIVGKGQEDLVDPAYDMIQAIRKNTEGDPAARKEQLYQILGRLGKISRFDGNMDGTVPTGDVFYINKFANGTGGNFEDLVTSAPHPDAVSSFRYALKDGVTAPVILKVTDKFEDMNGDLQPLYPTAQSAWETGADMYITQEGGKLKISVNPDGPPNLQQLPKAGESRILSAKEEKERNATGNLPKGSKPLYGAPLIVNTKTGSLLTDAVPVVGDFGPTKVVGDTLIYGDKSSIQGLSVDKLITLDTPTIDANARYVWAAQRGIKAKDSINIADTPMMEQLYREASKPGTDFAEAMAAFEKQGVTLSDGMKPTDYTSDSLLQHIQQQKTLLAKDLIGKDADLSSQEIALRINAPESFINSGFKATDGAQDFMVDPLSHTTATHLKLEYDIGSTSQVDGQILRGAIDTQYRINLIKQANQDQARSFFGRNVDQFIIDGESKDADILGIRGQGFLGAANSDYGTLGEKFQRVGRMVTQLATQRMSSNSNVLLPAVNSIRNDEVASAELGMFRAARLRTGAQYYFLPDALQNKYFPAGSNSVPDALKVPGGRLAVLKDSLKFDKSGNILDWNRDFTPEGFIHGDKFGSGEAGTYTFYPLSKKVADFEAANQQVNSGRVQARNGWRLAQGLDAKFDPNILYTPSIDTKNYPFLAYVKNRGGLGMADGGTSVIVGKTAKDLEDKISALGEGFSVYTKDQLKEFHQAAGDYEYSRNFNSGNVDAAIARKGILNDIFPDTRSDTIIKDYVDWHSKQELALVRDHVELGNAQLFEELRQMGKRFQDVATSQTGKVFAWTKRTADNPYDSYIKTALAVGPKDSQYPIWAYANEKTEQFFDTAFNTARNAFLSAKKGILPYEEASQMAEKFGLGNPYKAATDALQAYYGIANKIPPADFTRTFVSKANAILGATVIRLDTWQQLVHLVSAPILMSSEAASAIKSEFPSALKDLLTTALPDGSGRQVPAVSKVLFNAVTNYFDKSVRDQWLPIYKDLGIIRDNRLIDQHFEAINNLTLPYGKFSESIAGKAMDGLEKASDFAAKYVTMSDASNSILHFMAADVGRQVFEAAGLEGKELTDRIATFSNRIYGNFVASQRPVAFQGILGQAVGLFQSYYTNFMQQALRYVENGEGKSIALMAGLQTSLFGMQSLPGYQWINSHLVGNAAGNPTHGDFYSATSSYLGKDVGDFIMYGALSKITGAGLYTRGDINPRQLTILPVNPMNFPAVAGATRFLGAMYDLEQNIAKGGSVPSSILMGIEHNGLSRPLAGMAQLAQGFSTTSNGDLIARVQPVNGLSDLFSASMFSRLLGARPLDEAVAMDALYRSTLYTAKDHTRIQALGSAVRSTLLGGDEPSGDQISNFAKEYAASGGNIQNFSQKMIDWTIASKTSVANKVFRNIKENGNARNMMRIMGGQEVADYLNTSSTATSKDATQ